MPTYHSTSGYFSILYTFLVSCVQHFGTNSIALYKNHYHSLTVIEDMLQTMSLSLFRENLVCMPNSNLQIMCASGYTQSGSTRMSCW
jgi:hypothetical protein